MSKRKKYIKSCEISEVIAVQLGGFEQKILIEGNRKLLAQILGRELDESSTILPPFYVDYGKNITIGKNVWVQQCCTFLTEAESSLGTTCLSPRSLSPRK